MYMIYLPRPESYTKRPCYASLNQRRVVQNLNKYFPSDPYMIPREFLITKNSFIRVVEKTILRCCLQITGNINISLVQITS